MKLRSYLIVHMLCILVATAAAQTTPVYTDPLNKYKEALEFFERENYATAQQMLREYLEREPILYDRHVNTSESHARYLMAVCALELFQPDAEKLLLDFIYSNAYDNSDKRMAHYHMGRYYFREKEYDQAIEWLKKVHQSDLNKKERDEYKFLLAYCYFFSKELDQAYPLFKQIKDISNKYYYPSNYYYGYISFTKGRDEEALKSFEKIEGSKVYERILPFYISQIKFRRGEYKEVIDYLDPKIEDSRLSYYPELNLTLGRAYFEEGKFDKALPYLEAYHRGNGKARKEDIYQLGYCYYYAKDYSKAIRQFEYLDDEEDSIGQQALYLLADSYVKTNNTTNARSAYQKAAKIGIDPTITEYSKFNYAKLSYEAGYDNEAITALQEYVETYPSSKNGNEAKELLSELFLSAKDYEKALKVIESMKNLTPQVKKAYQMIAYNRGIQLFNNGSYPEAMEHFELSLKYPVLDEYKALAYYWKGECLYIQKEYQQSNWQYAKYLALEKTANIPDEHWYSINSRYSAGYAYLKRRDYKNAATYFEQVIDLSKNDRSPNVKDRILPDAILRAGDSYYLVKDYGRAVSHYDQVINLRGNGQDYAMYQKAYITGLQSNYNGKATQMLALQRQFPSSKYADIAVFEAASTYTDMGSNSAAINAFNTLIAKYPNSPYYNEAYLKLGLIYFNEDKFSKSVDAYDKVLENNPTTEEASIAFDGIKDITVATGDKNLLAKFMKKYPGKLDANEAEKINYDIAETQFRKQNYDQAVDKFTEYLTGFPDGAFALNAHYYRGESYYALDKYAEALTDLDVVIDQAPNRYLEPALNKASRIVYFENKDYERAIDLFDRLLLLTENEDDKYMANLGLMRSHYKLDDVAKAKTYADIVLKSEKAKPAEMIEANFYLAKAAYAKNDYTTALPLFEQTEKEASNSWAVESAWHIARMRFIKQDYEGAIEKCYYIINDMPAYQTWVIKSYILLGESYYGMDNIFQAKATLQSIIDNYPPEDDLKAEARRQLQIILDAEAANDKVLEDEDTSGTLEVEPSGTIDLVNPEEE